MQGGEATGAQLVPGLVHSLSPTLIFLVTAVGLGATPRLSSWPSPMGPFFMP